jgi:hypothetical protein
MLPHVKFLQHVGENIVGIVFISAKTVEIAAL